MVERQPVGLAVLAEFVNLKDLISLLTALQHQEGGEVKFVPVSTALVLDVVKRSLRIMSTKQNLLSFQHFQLMRYGDAQMQALRSLLRGVHLAIAAVPFDFGKFRWKDQSRSNAFTEVVVSGGRCKFTVGACSFTFSHKHCYCDNCERISLLSCTQCEELLQYCRDCSSSCPVASCVSGRVCDECSVVQAETEKILGCVACRFCCDDCGQCLPLPLRTRCDARICLNDTPASRCYECQEEAGIESRECNQCQGRYCEDCQMFVFCALCGEGRCDLCDGTFSCTVCVESYCKACEPSFSCAVCDNTFCIDCKESRQCFNCAVEHCAQCVEYSQCCECGSCRCPCTNYSDCDGCGLEMCATCVVKNSGKLDCVTCSKVMCSQCSHGHFVQCATCENLCCPSLTEGFFQCGGCDISLCQVCSSHAEVCQKCCPVCKQITCNVCEDVCCCCQLARCGKCSAYACCSVCQEDMCASCSDSSACPLCGEAVCTVCSAESVCAGREGLCSSCTESDFLDCAACDTSYHRAGREFRQCEGCGEDHCLQCIEQTRRCSECDNSCAICTCPCAISADTDCAGCGSTLCHFCVWRFTIHGAGWGDMFCVSCNKITCRECEVTCGECDIIRCNECVANGFGCDEILCAACEAAFANCEAFQEEGGPNKRPEMFSCRLCEQSFCPCTAKYTCGHNLLLSNCCDCGCDFCPSCALQHDGHDGSSLDSITDTDSDA